MLNFRWTYEAVGYLERTGQPPICVEVGRSHAVPVPGGFDPNAVDNLKTALDGVLEQIGYPPGIYDENTLPRAAESIGTTVSKVGGRIDYCRASIGTSRVVWSPEQETGPTQFQATTKGNQP